MRKPKTKFQILIIERYASRFFNYFVFCILIFNFFQAGCSQDSRFKTQVSKLQQIEAENKQLAYQLEQLKTENEQLKGQIEVLSGLGDEISFSDIYQVVTVKIGKFTNLYDEDRDGRKEKLIVYIQPIDGDGDVIKAVGQVGVSLWDLSKEAEQALLGKWEIKPAQLKKCWVSGFLASHYRLTFDVADKIDCFKQPLTVQITFTDYLTGKVFSQQKVIKP